MKQTIKERMLDIFEYFDTGDDSYYLDEVDFQEITKYIDKAYHDHFIEIINEEIATQPVYYRKMLEQLKSKLMEGSK